MVPEHQAQYDAVSSYEPDCSEAWLHDGMRKWVRGANEILRKAPVYFTQAERDRPRQVMLSLDDGVGPASWHTDN